MTSSVLAGQRSLRRAWRDCAPSVPPYSKNRLRKFENLSPYCPNPRGTFDASVSWGVGRKEMTLYLTRPPAVICLTLH
jgi:hypothetical protein